MDCLGVAIHGQRQEVIAQLLETSMPAAQIQSHINIMRTRYHMERPGLDSLIQTWLA